MASMTDGGLYHAKPVTSINPSGIAPGQAMQGLGQTRQGELDRAAQQQMQQQQLAQEQQLAEQQMAMQREQWEDMEARKDAETARIEKNKKARADAHQVLLEKLSARRAGAMDTIKGFDDELQVLQDDLAENEIGQTAASVLSGLYDIVAGRQPGQGMAMALDNIAQAAESENNALKTFGAQFVNKLGTYIQSSSLRTEGNLGLNKPGLWDRFTQGIANFTEGVTTEDRTRNDMEAFVSGMADAASQAYTLPDESVRPHLKAFFENAARIAMYDNDDDSGARAAMKSAYDLAKQAGVPESQLAAGLSLLREAGDQTEKTLIKTQLGIDAENLLSQSYANAGEEQRGFFNRLAGIDLSWASAVGPDGAFVMPADAFKSKSDVIKNGVSRAIQAIVSEPGMTVADLAPMLEALPEWGRNAFMEAMFDVRDNLAQELARDPELLRIYKPHLEKFLQGSKEDSLAQIADLINMGRSDTTRLREQALGMERRTGEINRQIDRAQASNVLSPGAIEALLGGLLETGDIPDDATLNSLLDLNL